jgi:hypothetical protein
MPEVKEARRQQLSKARHFINEKLLPSFRDGYITHFVDLQILFFQNYEGFELSDVLLLFTHTLLIEERRGWKQQNYAASDHSYLAACIFQLMDEYFQHNRAFYSSKKEKHFNQLSFDPLDTSE